MKPDELQKIAQKEAEAQKPYKYKVHVCCSSGCLALNSLNVLKAFEDTLKSQGLEKECRVSRTGCIGACYAGPVVRVEPGDVLYQAVSPEDVPEIIREHIGKGKPVNRLLYSSEGFFKKQHRLILRNAGHINPFRAEEYIAVGGFSSLLKALQMEPREVIEEITASGLRGRGGAGFPTGLKWSFVAQVKDTPKYLVANLDEGDPGVFANRKLAEANPHSIIEGMAIAMYAIGSEQGYIYIRGEYPLSVQTLRTAITQLKSLGLMGKNIFETPFSYDVEIRLGAGAFVAGEETAILASIEGKRATPRPRPPYPANSGLWGKPTIINNVETLANIPLIISNGAPWFSSIGLPTCTGTKCFSITGKIANAGLIEVPMGTKLNEVIFEIGGGVPGRRKFKAVLVGGPSGGGLPEKLLDLPIDYDSLTKAGAIMGSGGIVVIDDESCMVDTAKFFTDFCVDESCGKCTPCRVGLLKMHGILEKITNGEGSLADLAMLEDWGGLIKEASLCGLGQTGPNPVLSTLRYFRDEYVAHVVEKRCPAGKCFKDKERK